MSKASKTSNEQQEQQEQQASAPDWVREAQAHYAATGSYRPDDVARILGDQKISVEVAPKTDDVI